ncbi:MAG: DUF3750 domain-containing protein [Akkermansiaceae bacterium]|nr:DUF3750 domain-containing protein [Armatimonadota bacterium]
MSDMPAESVTVELWYAPLPRPLSRFAWHHWFVVRDGPTAVRWEVWQRQGAGGESAGHIYKNLMRPESGVGGGASVRLFTWQGAEAENIARILERAWTNYPHRTRYLAFPGPNSNTFVAWVLKRSGLAGDGALLLRWQAIGRVWWL